MFFDGHQEVFPIYESFENMLLLYYIYRGCGELRTSDAAEALSFTATSISRASRQLKDFGLAETEKRGVQKSFLPTKPHGSFLKRQKVI